MDLILPTAQAYAERFSSPEDDVLSRVAASTQKIHPEAHMLSGQLQGNFLQFISRVVQPQTILEIGTFTGYSAICLAKGLKPGGKLHTIELRERDASIALENFNLADVQDKIILHTGNALKILPELDELWDLVFIDADKSSYIEYYKMVLPKLRKGGVMLADNVLFHGKVLETNIHGKNAKAIQAFNEYVSGDDSVDNVLLTIRDGLLMIIKK